LPYKVIKKVKSIKKVRKKSIKKVRRGSIKNARKGDATVIASGSNALSTSYQTLINISLSPSGYISYSIRL